MINVIYLLGYPGSGKTTVTRAALAQLGVPARVDAPVPHQRVGDVWSLGVDREPFGGTDTLSMSIQPKVASWLFTLKPPAPRILLGEGDRLANSKFFAQVADAGHHLTLIHLALPRFEARERARARALAAGLQPQDSAWWNGRVTKTDNLVNSRPVLTWDATIPPYVLASNLHTLLTS